MPKKKKVKVYLPQSIHRRLLATLSSFYTIDNRNDIDGTIDNTAHLLVVDPATAMTITIRLGVTVLNLNKVGQ